MSKSLPPAEQLRENAYNLHHRFSDVLELIQAKHEKSQCDCRFELIGPASFLSDALKEFREFLYALHAFIDADDEESDQDSESELKQLHRKVDKMIRLDADGSGKWVEQAIEAFYEGYLKDEAGMRRSKKKARVA